MGSGRTMHNIRDFYPDPTIRPRPVQTADRNSQFPIPNSHKIPLPFSSRIDYYYHAPAFHVRLILLHTT